MASRRLSSRDERWEVRYSVWMQVCTVPPNPTDLRPVGAIFDRVMDQSPGIQVTRRTDCSVSKAWSIGGGFLSRLEFDGCRCVRTSAIQLRFSIYLSPFLSLFFSCSWLACFPQEQGSSWAKVPPMTGLAVMFVISVSFFQPNECIASSSTDAPPPLGCH